MALYKRQNMAVKLGFIKSLETGVSIHVGHLYVSLSHNNRSFSSLHIAHSSS